MIINFKKDIFIKVITGYYGVAAISTMPAIAGFQSASTTTRQTATTTSVSAWHFPFSSKKSRIACFDQKIILIPAIRLVEDFFSCLVSKLL